MGRCSDSAFGSNFVVVTAFDTAIRIACPFAPRRGLYKGHRRSIWHDQGSRRREIAAGVSDIGLTDHRRGEISGGE
jgi:hypothetical protein